MWENRFSEHQNGDQTAVSAAGLHGKGSPKRSVIFCRHWYLSQDAIWSRKFGTQAEQNAANLRTKILDFRGFDSSRILISRGGILMFIGNFPESVGQRISVWRCLVWRLAVAKSMPEIEGLCQRRVYGQSPNWDSLNWDLLTQTFGKTTFPPLHSKICALTQAPTTWDLSSQTSKNHKYAQSTY